MFPQIHAENDKEESDLSFFLLFLGSAIAKKPDSTCSESNELINEINHIWICLHHRELNIETKKILVAHSVVMRIQLEVSWKKQIGKNIIEMKFGQRLKKGDTNMIPSTCCSVQKRSQPDW